MTKILYSFRRCPYAMRARMAIKYSGIKVQIYEISLKNKPTSMLKASPKGQVPVLILENGDVIDESRDIINYALQNNDPDNWLIKDAQGEELININDGEFKSNLDKYKYCTKEDSNNLENYISKGEEFLKILNERLNKNDYLFSNNISYVDIAIFPFIRQFAHVDKDWFYKTPYLKLQNWLDNFLESDLFKSIMVKDLKEL